MTESTKTTAPDLPAPSEEFQMAAMTGGCASTTCQLCGRHHFSSAQDITEDEMEALKVRAIAEPNKYCMTDDHSVAVGEISGMIVVPDCPCRQLRKYEDWVWANRAMIVKYLTARAAADREQAAHIHEEIALLEVTP